MLLLLANFANGSFLAFPTTLSTVFGKITFTLLQSLITAVVKVVDVNEPIVAKYRVKADAVHRASHPNIRLAVRKSDE